MNCSENIWKVYWEQEFVEVNILNECCILIKCLFAFFIWGEGGPKFRRSTLKLKSTLDVLHSDISY